MKDQETQQRFIELRFRGWSFNGIAAEPKGGVAQISKSAVSPFFNRQAERSYQDEKFHDHAG